VFDRFPRSARVQALLCAGVLLGGALDARAQQPTSSSAPQLPALKQLTLEELLDVDVTLPLRRPERGLESAAAVSVLTSEDIWRSGAVVLPEVLRAAPGLFVGRFSNTSWVVTARGFASTSANKMLVMMDGRSVYSPLFSGVFWEQLDYPLADLDRIEIVRGPGASLWGSNAVNGAIHIVSKNARDTQGTLISGGTGSEEHGFGSVRHGGRAGNGYYRLYGKFAARDDAHLEDGTPGGDWQRVGHVGSRFDFGSDTNGVMLQGEVFTSRSGLAGRDDLESSGGHVLGEWKRDFGAGNHLQLQFYYDRTARLVPLQFQEVRDTYDVELQHRKPFGARHVFAWGGGYRLSRDNTTPTVLLFFDPEDRTTHLLSAFAQDEFAVHEDVVVTAGARLELNHYTGLEAQPTARVRWMPDTTQTVWGGISRAVRLPTRLDTDVRVLSEGRVVIAGNPDFSSEEVIALDAGYRVNPLDMFAADLSVFRNRYNDLRSQEPGEPATIGNGLNARASGFELTARLQPRDWLRVTASYARLALSLTLDPDSRDVRRGAGEAVDPEHQWFVQGRANLPGDIELDTHLRHVSALPDPGTPAYTEATVRLAWRPSARVELSLVGRDLLRAHHLEFVSPTSPRRSAMERAVYTRISVAF
jgi:iron complex outermembrane recepter protein